jgi:hypothetical protein
MKPDPPVVLEAVPLGSGKGQERAVDCQVTS